MAETLDEARAAWEFEDGEPAIYLHSYIGRCRIVYARDVEDAHEDAEPGGTTVDYCPDDGRALRDGECRVWMLGQIGIQSTPAWPGDTRRVTVTVAGEVVATGVRERTADVLRDMRIARLTAEWEAEQFAAYEHAGAAA